MQSALPDGFHAVSEWIASGAQARTKRHADFGGKAWNTPTAINQHGIVAGFLDFPGDDNGAPNFHAFMWTGAGPSIDLHAVGTDPFSAAFDINNKDQIVKQSFDADFNSRAALWQNGQDLDLNALAEPGSPFLIFANEQSADQLEQRADSWRPWRSYAAMYLWKAVVGCETVLCVPSERDAAAPQHQHWR